MYYLLHRQKVPDQVTKMPEGLPDLMSDISREVLRAQPENHCIYKFISDYLEALLRVREKAFMAQTIIDELIQTSETISNFLQTAGISYEKSNRAAEVIQTAFHEFMKKKRGEKPQGPKEFNEIELLTELINNCKFTQKEIERSRPAIRQAYRQFVNDYLHLMKTTVYGAAEIVPVVQLTLESKVLTRKLAQLNQAATIIQAYFRAHLTRQSLRRTSIEFEIFITRVLRKATPFKTTKRFEPFQSAKYECVRDKMELCKFNKAADIIQRSFRRWYYKMLYHYNLPYPILNRAAIIIQSAVRGFLVRKLMPSLKRQSILNRYSSITDECEIRALNNSALKIQTVYRGFKTRKNYKHEKEMVKYAKRYADPTLLELFNKSASIIQRAYVRYKKKKTNKFDFAEIVMQAAAMKIQSLFRGFVARKRFQKMKKEKEAKQLSDTIEKSEESEKPQSTETTETEKEEVTEAQEIGEIAEEEVKTDEVADVPATTNTPQDTIASEVTPEVVNESEQNTETEQTHEETGDKTEEQNPTESIAQPEVVDLPAENVEQE